MVEEMDEEKFWGIIARHFMNEECDFCVVSQYQGKNPKYKRRCENGCAIAIKHVYEHIRRKAKETRRNNNGR